MADDQSRSRRAIDLHTADQFGRLDERLKTLSAHVSDIQREVFGGPGRPGLGEQVRTIIKTWGLFIGIVSTLLAWTPWIYDHFIQKGLNTPIFGQELRDKWIKDSTKRVKILNKETGAWEYYYMISESKDQEGK